MKSNLGITEESLWHRIRNLHARFPGTITAEELRAVIIKSGRQCCWCLKKNLVGRDLTIEHLGNTNDPNTLAVACYRCNSAHNAGARKRSDIPEEVRRHREQTAHRNWEKENVEAVRAAKHADYVRNKETRRRYLEVNRERILAEKKRYRVEKKAKIAVYQKQWDADNKVPHAEQRRQWREKNKDVVKRRWSEYANSHREELNAKARKRAQENREQINARKRERRLVRKMAHALLVA